jgi:phosphatidylinositol-bisphosphatase
MVSGKASNQVKLGLKGFAGNKGALAFRFDLLNSSFCFINAHLAPHKQNFKLRNENVQTICRTIKFQLPSTALNIFEHDFVFWFGDLNYRIDTIETKNIIRCIAKNNFDDCLKYDQLDTAKRELNVLSDFSEGKIDFCPTFKYLIGSNQHNVKRDPAWCDRILWRGPASLHRYGCCDSIQVSDHKPVFSYFSLKLKRTDISKMQEVKVQIYKEIDEIHHQAMPKALVSQDTLAFPDLRYKISQHNTFEITNTGSSRFSFELIADQWIKCSPYAYNLTPNESVEVKVTITLNADYYKKSRSSSVNLSKFIRIKINGK